MAATSVVVLDRGNNTTCTINLHVQFANLICNIVHNYSVPCLNTRQYKEITSHDVVYYLCLEEVQCSQELIEVSSRP
ncbi:hypothetical protein Bhyg_00986 [Pseudolycoriella hygida]|uniref:Uncharacterized protein n=1 Tax=Pseudolycoriella hygida TaxID=35572 RepID=A0A9Q0N9D9_9DIPT|nr:hypothetical protein Bhyg_00986 [Pseudolycoriella hygida]